MLIQEHINFNHGSAISNYSKTEVKPKERSFDVSESLSNILANFTNELIKNDKAKIQNINTLKKTMRGGRNIVVPKIQNKDPIAIKLKNNGKFYSDLKQAPVELIQKANLLLKSTLTSDQCSDYISSYFHNSPPTSVQVQTGKLPPIIFQKHQTPKPSHSVYRQSHPLSRAEDCDRLSQMERHRPSLDVDRLGLRKRID